MIKTNKEQSEFDYKFITEIIEDLKQAGIGRGSKAYGMLTDWQNEIITKMQYPVEKRVYTIETTVGYKSAYPLTKCLVATDEEFKRLTKLNGSSFNSLNEFEEYVNTVGVTKNTVIRIIEE